MLISTPWRTKISALLLWSALLLFITTALSACSTPPVATRECVDDETEIVLCNQGLGEMQRSCQHGRWENGDCSPLPQTCRDGQFRYTPCGNGGALVEQCHEDTWQSERSCAESCTLGESFTQSCGPNNGGTERIVCTEQGIWNYEPCTSVDVCPNGQTQLVRCEENGIQEQRCQKGQWTTDGVCQSDCQEGASIPVRCGTNGRGLTHINCIDNRWSEEQHCQDNDVCENNAVQKVSCYDFGEQKQRCLQGVWVNEGVCDIECLPGQRYSLACGFNERGIQNYYCDQGRWAAPVDCDDQDECYDYQWQTVSCQVYGTQRQQCLRGTWFDSGACEIECLPHETLVTACGLNLRGSITESCQAGKFTDNKICVDPDECIDGESAKGRCERSDIGYEPYQCTEGQWQQEHCQHSSLSASVGHALRLPFGLCSVDYQGFMRCLGTNADNQRGNSQVGTSSWYKHSLAKVVQVSYGFSHVCARTSDKRVYCWGSNSFGQLGLGDTSKRQTPATPVTLNNIHQIATGFGFSCALTNTKNVYCWGKNDLGQLGVGHTTQLLYPAQVVGLPRIQSIAAGSTNACAISESGQLFCWGNNTSGQLGNGNKSSTTVPLAVSTMQNVSKVAVGWNHICAIQQKEVFCWGNNTGGQLGNRSATESLTPQRAFLPVEVSTIALGHQVSCALETSGSVYCWGSNVYGELGRPTEDISENSTPAPVIGANQMSSLTVSSGKVAADPANTVCTQHQSGSIHCWGFWFPGLPSPTPAKLTQTTIREIE